MFCFSWWNLRRRKRKVGLMLQKRKTEGMLHHRARARLNLFRNVPNATSVITRTYTVYLVSIRQRGRSMCSYMNILAAALLKQVRSVLWLVTQRSNIVACKTLDSRCKDKSDHLKWENKLQCVCFFFLFSFPFFSHLKSLLCWTGVFLHEKPAKIMEQPWLDFVCDAAFVEPRGGAEFDQKHTIFL